MDWWIWLLIILGVLLLVGIIVVGGRAAREKKLEGKRVEATELRREAQQQSESAEQRERMAAEEADRARREREAAEERARRADEIDPDVDVDTDPAVGERRRTQALAAGFGPAATVGPDDRPTRRAAAAGVPGRDRRCRSRTVRVAATTSRCALRAPASTGSRSSSSTGSSTTRWPIRSPTAPSTSCESPPREGHERPERQDQGNDRVRGRRPLHEGHAAAGAVRQLRAGARRAALGRRVRDRRGRAPGPGHPAGALGALELADDPAGVRAGRAGRRRGHRRGARGHRRAARRRSTPRSARAGPTASGARRSSR